MRSQNTQPTALREVSRRWQERTRDPDPIVRAAARELLADLDERPRSRTEYLPAYWRAVIDQVISQEPRSSVRASGYKTGHGHAHGSKSGTCVSVDTARGVWYCSSCRRGGTAVTWQQEIDQCSYGEAWEVLAGRFGAACANADSDD